MRSPLSALLRRALPAAAALSCLVISSRPAAAQGGRPAGATTRRPSGSGAPSPLTPPPPMPKPAARTPGAATVSAAATSGVGRIVGFAWDSIARRPMTGATVQILRADNPAAIVRQARVDSTGRFTLDSLAPTVYIAGVATYPMLDSLDIELPLERVEVQADSTTPIRFAIPMPATIARAVCDGAPASDSTGTLIGRVYDARTLAAQSQATVQAEWSQTVFDMAGIRARRMRAQATSRMGGGFALCNVPANITLAVFAARGADSTEFVPITVPARSVIRRDFLIAPRLIASGDSAATGNAVLVGRVRTATGQPLPGAQVRLVTGGRAVRTDSAGSFRLASLPNGTHSVEVRAVGYLPQREVVNLIAGQPATLNLALDLLKNVLDTVRVTAARSNGIGARLAEDFNRRKQMGTGYYLTDADVARIRPVETTDLFSRFPGLQLSPSGASGDRALTMRGNAGTCEPTVYLNRMRMEGLSANDVNMMVNPNEVSGVEIYNDPVRTPVEFQSMSGCGAIVIWTKTMMPTAKLPDKPDR